MSWTACERHGGPPGTGNGCIGCAPDTSHPPQAPIVPPRVVSELSSLALHRVVDRLPWAPAFKGHEWLTYQLAPWLHARPGLMFRLIDGPGREERLVACGLEIKRVGRVLVVRSPGATEAAP